jgi:hypothetical protein
MQTKRCPESFQWSVEYYPILNIQKDQLARQTAEPGVNNIDQLKEKVSKKEGEKLPEDREESSEIGLQKAKDLTARVGHFFITSRIVIE